MVYICNVKGLQEVEKLGKNECILHRLPRSPVMSDCSRPYQFKVIWSIENPPLMVCNTENRASLQILPDKLQISGKR